MSHDVPEFLTLLNLFFAGLMMPAYCIAPHPNPPHPLTPPPHPHPNHHPHPTPTVNTVQNYPWHLLYGTADCLLAAPVFVGVAVFTASRHI